jgi:hypothetical protein
MCVYTVEGVDEMPLCVFLQLLVGLPPPLWPLWVSALKSCHGRQYKFSSQLETPYGMLFVHLGERNRDHVRPSVVDGEERGGLGGSGLVILRVSLLI